MNPSIFDNLLEKLISESYFTQDAINKILDAELHRRSPKKSATYAGSPPSLAKSSSLTAAIRPTTGNSFEEGKKIISTFDPDDQTSPEKEGGKNSLSPVQSLHQSGSRNTKTPFKKNSLDIGELSISEYSVGSNFLKDGYDDQEESSLRKSDYTNNTYMNDSIVPRQSRIVSVGVRDREIGKELEFSKNLNDNNSLLDQVTNPRYLYKSELGPEIGELSPNTSNERIKLEFD